MMEIEAAFTKEQLKSVFALRGMVNADSVHFDGADWLPGGLAFLGFAGRRYPDSLYHGICRFAAGDIVGGEQVRTSFADLMDWIAGTDSTDKEELPDGIQSYDN